MSTVNDLPNNSPNDSPNDILAENFELSDIDSDEDIELKDFPEPYNTLGQFIMTAIVGAIVHYIVTFRNKKDIDNKEYHKYINKYFNYCKNSNDDLYINEINSILLKYDCNFLDFVDKINNTAILIADDLMLFNDSYSRYTNTDNIDIESLNSEIAQNIISVLDLNVLKKII